MSKKREKQRRRLKKIKANTAVTESKGSMPRKADKLLAEPESVPKGVLGRILRWGYGIVTVVVTVLGLAVLVPSIHVEPSFSLDKTNPFGTQFLLSNSGLFSIRDVRFTCNWRKVTTQGRIQVEFTNVTIDHSPPPIPEIARGESSTVFCARTTGVDFSTADIEVRVTFKPKFWPYEIEKRSRFELRQDSQGTIIWAPKPISATN